MASMATQERAFDLNIQRILEHWTISDAVREIIANALDEQILSGTADISITQDSAGMWHIRDYGRGIMYQHLTQKENAEKLRNGKLIGKFGVGLKDALATFHRRHVAVAIRSRYGDMTLVELNKHGFSDVKTLHVAIYPPSDPEMKGSEFVLSGCSAEDIQKAKGLFLRFSGEQILEETTYGQVLQRLGSAATACAFPKRREATDVACPSLAGYDGLKNV